MYPVLSCGRGKDALAARAFSSSLFSSFQLHSHGSQLQINPAIVIYLTTLSLKIVYSGNTADIPNIPLMISLDFHGIVWGNSFCPDSDKLV